METKETFTILSVRATTELKEELERLAREDKRSISNYVALVLEQHVAAKQQDQPQEATA